MIFERGGYILSRVELSSKDSGNLLISKKHTKVSRFQKACHAHNHYEIMLVTNPSNEHWFFQVGASIYTCGKHSIQFSIPGEEHRSIRSTKNTSRILVNIREAYMNPISRFLNININELFSNHVLNYTNDQFNKIKSLLDETYNEFKSSIPGSENTRLKLLISTSIFEMSIFESIADFSPLKPDNIESAEIVKDYIESNYASRITLDELAAIVPENKFYLCRHFKNATGYTIFDYLLNVRLAKGKEYLSQTSMSVIKISEIVGFNSPSYFSNKFKKYYGISPTEYRKLL